MLSCCFKFCTNIPEILCLCSEPSIMICKDHILDHISLFNKCHKVESLFAEIPKENKLAVVVHIEAQIKKLLGFKTIFIEKAAESINCIISRMNSELKTIDENISSLAKLIKETQSISKAPKINGSDMERCLSLPTAEGIDFLKTYLPEICLAETLEIKSMSFWERNDREELIIPTCEPFSQRINKNLKRMTGYNTFVKEKFVELCKEGEKLRATEIIKVIAEMWNSLSYNQKITYAESARKLKEKVDVQIKPQNSILQKNNCMEANDNESECDIIEVIENCIS